MYCELCRVTYPASYDYCPNDGAQLRSRGQDKGAQCRSCGNLSEQRNGFCGQCGADLTEAQATEVPKTRPAEGEAPSRKTEPEPAQPTSNQTRSSFSSVFKKQINDDLAEAFSSCDPPETPWFGIDLDADLVAVTPYGVIVASIIDPGSVEEATIYKSLFPEGPWLLTTPDGTERAIDNPLVSVTRAMRIFENKLAAFFKHQRRTSQNITVKGLIVFPDGYDLENANEPYTLAEGSAGVRVINASGLPEEMLRTPRQARLSPELWREWLYTSVLPSRDDDSIALTWLDPKGDTISKRVRTFAAGQPVDNHRALPPRSQRFSNLTAGPFAQEARSRIATIAGFSLVLVLGSVALWHVYTPKAVSQRFLNDRVLGKNARTPEVPGLIDSTAGSEPQQREAPAPGESNSSTPENSNPSNRNHLPADKMVGSEAPNALSPAEKTSPDVNPAGSIAASQKTIEDRIGRAIQQRAVDGVFVVFINDTAYLTGAVLSGKQKVVAEQAARNVPGVKRVQSSISVKWETS